MTNIPERRLIAAIRSWPNHPWIVLPGPVDLTNNLAAHLVSELGLELEVFQSIPVFIPEFDDDGQPVMYPNRIPDIQKSRLEWVTKHRLVTPLIEGDVE